MGKQRIEVIVSFELDLPDEQPDEANVMIFGDEIVERNENRVRQAISDAMDAIEADGVSTDINTRSLVINGETWDV